MSDSTRPSEPSASATVNNSVRFVAIPAEAGVPRLALTRAEAATALGMSLDSFERHVQPDLRLVRRGKLRVVPVSELERWLERNAEAVLDTGSAA